MLTCLSPRKHSYLERALAAQGKTTREEVFLGGSLFGLVAASKGSDGLQCDAGGCQIRRVRQDTYRQDGNDDPHGTEHGVVDGLADFQGVLDALVVAVKAAAVRLNGARLDDEEGQSRWGSTQEGKGREKRGQCKRPKGNILRQRLPQMSGRNATAIPTSVGVCSL